MQRPLGGYPCKDVDSRVCRPASRRRLARKSEAAASHCPRSSRMHPYHAPQRGAARADDHDSQATHAGCRPRFMQESLQRSANKSRWFPDVRVNTVHTLGGIVARTVVGDLRTDRTSENPRADSIMRTSLSFRYVRHARVADDRNAVPAPGQTHCPKAPRATAMLSRAGTLVPGVPPASGRSIPCCGVRGTPKRTRRSTPRPGLTCDPWTSSIARHMTGADWIGPELAGARPLLAQRGGGRAILQNLRAESRP